jgi:O-antigen ligase
VRYRGELNDPNEVSLTICAGALSLLIAFAIRRRGSLIVVVYWIAAAIVAWTVVMTQSRGGLVAVMLVPGVYVVRKYGFKALVPALIVALPVLMLGGRSGESADESTRFRYEAWATGLDMFHHSPIFGVGARQFTEHNFLTAHNSYVLTLSELGLPGMVMFVSIIYLSVKSLVVGLRELRDIPEAEVATTWGMSLLASMSGILFQINTLSFAYHSVLWVFFGLVGAWCSAVRSHRPEFRVGLTRRDLLIISAACLVYALLILPVFLKIKGVA